MANKKDLLTTKQMAKFVADGFLRFDDVVPAVIESFACIGCSE